jgi:hypothetical protein
MPNNNFSKLSWELIEQMGWSIDNKIEYSGHTIERAPIAGGWLVRYHTSRGSKDWATSGTGNIGGLGTGFGDGGGICFVPDPNGSWKLP